MDELGILNTESLKNENERYYYGIMTVRGWREIRTIVACPNPNRS
jgi:hypothetical protein